jgi:hypothetical protein
VWYRGEGVVDVDAQLLTVINERQVITLTGLQSDVCKHHGTGLDGVKE